MLAALARLGSTLLVAGRLWLAHAPVLLTIALAGTAARQGAIWAAIEVSAWNSTVAYGILVLAPLSLVTASVLMLVTLRPGLPRLAEIGERHGPLDPSTGRERRLVDVLASVFVPFLALYAANGYLTEDRFRFVNSVVARETIENADVFYAPERVNLDRIFFAEGWVAVVVVLLAVVLRWGIGRLEGKVNARTLGFVGAYVEAFWLVTLAGYLSSYVGTVWTWLGERSAIATLNAHYAALLEMTGPLGRPVRFVLDGIAGLLGDLDDVVVIPVAWLAMGAVVYGYKLSVAPREGRHGRLDARAQERLERASKRWGSVPQPVRRIGGEAVKPLVGDVTSRFSALRTGLAQLAVGGLGPMLAFALAFLLATRLESFLLMGFHAVVGPRELSTALAFAPHASAIAAAISLTVIMALLAAGVDQVVAAGRARERAEAEQAAAERAAVEASATEPPTSETTEGNDQPTRSSA